MSNRSLKVELWNEDSRCYWCGRHTHLTDTPRIQGRADPLMATIDHIVSRFYLHRWVKKKKGQKRKVLSCYECNHKRSVQETLSLSRSEVVKRSQGFSLNPRGNPKIIKPLSTARETLARLNT
jgi:ribosomal protein S14